MVKRAARGIILTLLPVVILGLAIAALPASAQMQVGAKRTHDVAILSITADPTTAWGGEPVYIDVTVENQGDYTETFNTTVYADKNTTIIGDEIVVGIQTVYNLPPETNQTLNYVWNTTGAPSGTYQISGYASEVPHEKDTDDNWLVAGARVGGVWGAQPGSGNIFEPRVTALDMLLPLSPVILYLCGLAIVAFGIFKALMSIRLRWPWSP